MYVSLLMIYISEVQQWSRHCAIACRAKAAQSLVGRMAASMRSPFGNTVSK
jgi:hypothetical protein